MVFLTMHETLVCENLRNVKLEWFYGLFDIRYTERLGCDHAKERGQRSDRKKINCQDGHTFLR